MKRSLLSTLAATLLLGISTAQSVSQSQSTTVGSTGAVADVANQIAAGTIIPAELAKALDAKKAKPNDEVVAKTAQDLLAHGHIVVPRGSKLIGHVTEAKSRSNTEPQSIIGIIFDRLLLKDGRTVPLQVAVQAIRGPARSASTVDREMGAGAEIPSYPGR